MCVCVGAMIEYDLCLFACDDVMIECHSFGFVVLVILVFDRI